MSEWSIRGVESSLVSAYASEMDKIKWSTESRLLGDLRLFDKNPRILRNKARLELIESIEKFDLAEIPVVNHDNVVIAGNQRVSILMEQQGPAFSIEVRVPNRQLSDDECKEYLLRSNKNTGDWDFDSLSEEFDTGMLLDVGFTTDELQGEKSPMEREEKDPDFNFGVKGMDLSNFESYDYIILMFDNLSDYVRACEKIGIEERVDVKLARGVRRTGFGRAIDGNRVIESLTD